MEKPWPTQIKIALSYLIFLSDHYVKLHYPTSKKVIFQPASHSISKQSRSLPSHVPFFFKSYPGWQEHSWPMGVAWQFCWQRCLLSHSDRAEITPPKKKSAITHIIIYTQPASKSWNKSIRTQGALVAILVWIVATVVLVVAHVLEVDALVVAAEVAALRTLAIRRSHRPRACNFNSQRVMWVRVL